MKLTEYFVNPTDLQTAINSAEDLHNVKLPIDLPKGSQILGMEPKDGGLLARYMTPIDSGGAANE